MYVFVCMRVCMCVSGSVWLHVLVNILMSKVFVTPLTHRFSILLLPWKHGSHGNKDVSFGDGWSVGAGVD